MRGYITQDMMDCIPEVDFNSGYRYFLGNAENYTRALLSILKSIKSKLPLLQQMIITDEYEGLRTIAQTLRKMLGNIGAAGIAEDTYELELALYNEELYNMQELLTLYVMKLVNLADQLETLLKKLDAKNSELKEEDDPKSFLHYDFTKTKESIKLSADLLERKII